MVVVVASPLVEPELEVEVVVLLEGVEEVVSTEVVLDVVVLVLTLGLAFVLVIVELDQVPHVVGTRFLVVGDSYSERVDLEREVVVMNEVGIFLALFVAEVRTVTTLGLEDEVVAVLVELVSGRRLEMEVEL